MNALTDSLQSLYLSAEIVKFWMRKCEILAVEQRLNISLPPEKKQPLPPPSSPPSFRKSAISIYSK